MKPTARIKSTDTESVVFAKVWSIQQSEMHGGACLAQEIVVFCVHQDVSLNSNSNQKQNK